MSPLLVCSLFICRVSQTLSASLRSSAASVSARLQGVIRKVSRVPIIGVQNIHVPFCLVLIDLRAASHSHSPLSFAGHILRSRLQSSFCPFSTQENFRQLDPAHIYSTYLDNRGSLMVVLSLSAHLKFVPLFILSPPSAQFTLSA